MSFKKRLKMEGLNKLKSLRLKILIFYSMLILMKQLGSAARFKLIGIKLIQLKMKNLVSVLKTISVKWKNGLIRAMKPLMQLKIILMQ